MIIVLLHSLFLDIQIRSITTCNTYNMHTPYRMIVPVQVCVIYKVTVLLLNITKLNYSSSSIIYLSFTVINSCNIIYLYEYLFDYYLYCLAPLWFLNPVVSVQIIWIHCSMLFEHLWIYFCNISGLSIYNYCIKI